MATNQAQLGERIASKGCNCMKKTTLNQVDIRWTENDVPHIQADNYHALGFGYGYVHGRDRLHEIIGQVIALRGERSKYYGAETFSTIGFLKTTNLNSDLMFKIRMPKSWVEEEWQNLSDDAKAYVRGYSEGLNHFVDTLPSGEPSPFDEQNPCIRFEVGDVIRSAMRFGIMKELIEIGPHILESCCDHSELQTNSPHRKEVEIEGGFGSNAWAFGGDVVNSEGAIVLGNPHSAWKRTPHQQRIYMHQYHLTIPGELDVAGCSFLGFPLPMTGYNADVSWSILDAASTTSFVMQRMDVELETDKPSYQMDGEARELTIRTIKVDVLEKNNQIVTHSYSFFESELGPLFHLPEKPGKPEGWYAFTNPGEKNAQGLDQFLAAAKSKTTAQFVDAIERHRGILCQLVVGDRHGDVAYVLAGRVPPLTDSAAEKYRFNQHCAFNVLDGSRQECRLRDEHHRPLIAPRCFYPKVLSRGIIHNANNSYKYSEFGREQADYPAVFGQHQSHHQIGKPIAAGLRFDPRLAMSFKRMQELTKAGCINRSQILEVLFDNRNYAGETFLDDILALQTRDCDARAQLGFETLRQWDRKNNSDSCGALLFHQFWNRLVQLGLLSMPVSGDPALGSDLDSSTCAQHKIVQALSDSVEELQQFGFAANQKWGSVLRETASGNTISLHGGSYIEGVLNGEMPAPLTEKGFPHILFGSAYIQLSEWRNGQLIIEGVLTHGQRDGIESIARTQQLNLFAQKRLSPIAFHQASLGATNIVATKRLVLN